MRRPSRNYSKPSPKTCEHPHEAAPCCRRDRYRHRQDHLRRGLTGALDGVYWKPVQSGDLDADRHAILCCGCRASTPNRSLPEVYRLRTPASPHLAAEIDGVDNRSRRAGLPETDRPLIVEGAGGLLVPLTRDITYIDVIARWNIPVVLCARTTLGTINHSLLSIEALRARGIALLGIAFIGDENVEIRTHHRRLWAASGGSDVCRISRR